MRTIVYQGNEKSIKMGSYIFVYGVPQNVPDNIAESILGKPVLFGEVKVSVEGEETIINPKKPKPAKKNPCKKC